MHREYYIMNRDRLIKKQRKYWEENKPEYTEKAGNPGWQKKTLVDSNYFAETAGLFKWLSGSDIRRKKTYEPEKVGRYIEEYRNIYGFLNETELLELDNYLLKKDLTIAFSRGDSDKIAIVDITKEHKKHAATKKEFGEYLKKEIEINKTLKREQGVLIYKDKEC